MRNPRMEGNANWFPTDPIRSLRPSVSISFLFSFPFIAVNMFAIHDTDHTRARIIPITIKLGLVRNKID